MNIYLFIDLHRKRAKEDLLTYIEKEQKKLKIILEIY